MVSVVIPAFNEFERIENVLLQVVRSDLIKDIIVIDDGSTDNTSKVVSKFKEVRLIRNDSNKGKHACLIRGIENSLHDVILLLDADLNKLTVDHINLLVLPVLNSECDMNIGYRGGTNIIDRLASNPSLSGQRCIRKSEFFKIRGIYDAVRFQTEMVLNSHYLNNDKLISVTFLKGLDHSYKVSKRTLYKGIEQELLMFKDVVSCFGIKELIKQYFKISVKSRATYLIKNKKTVLLKS